MMDRVNRCKTAEQVRGLLPLIPQEKRWMAEYKARRLEEEEKRVERKFFYI